jgi:hypothetical protein
VTTAATQKQLLVLAADKNIEFAVRGLFARPESLGIAPLSFDVFVHPAKDAGCLLKSADILRAFCRQYAFAMVLFDREGCGRQQASREELESDVEADLSKSGWQGRCSVIVLDPELEVWVWSESPVVRKSLGWTGSQEDLARWLQDAGYQFHGTKPARPKEALESVLRRNRKPRSSAIYHELASQVSLRRCSDPAFAKFTTTIQTWFRAR